MREHDADMHVLRATLSAKMTMLGWTYADVERKSGVPRHVVREMYRGPSRSLKTMDTATFDALWAVAVA